MAALLEVDTVIKVKNKEPNRPLSRYNKIGLILTKDELRVSLEAVAVQESWDPPSIPELPQDTFFEVGPAYINRPDLISLAVYGTEQLYWVIAYANKMTDPFAQTRQGLKLRIPDRENLFQSILAV